MTGRRLLCSRSCDAGLKVHAEVLLLTSLYLTQDYALHKHHVANRMSSTNSSVPHVLMSQLPLCGLTDTTGHKISAQRDAQDGCHHEGEQVVRAQVESRARQAAQINNTIARKRNHRPQHHQAHGRGTVYDTWPQSKRQQQGICKRGRRDRPSSISRANPISSV